MYERSQSQNITYLQALNEMSADEKQVYDKSWAEKKKCYEEFIQILIERLNDPLYDNSLLNNKVIKFDEVFPRLIKQEVHAEYDLKEEFPGVIGNRTWAREDFIDIIPTHEALAMFG